MVFAQVFRNAATGDLSSALSLIDAARGAYQKALNEGLPLAYIAGKTGRPQYWFAANILHVVDVLGQPSGNTAHQVLTRNITTGLKLADDMAAMIAGDGRPAFADLRVTSAAFERYMAWASTVC
jgi:hypothetical protein